MESNRQTAPTGSGSSEWMSDESGRTWPQWPVCSGCGQRRSTRCPTCHIGGDHFARAETDDDSNVMLMCPVCGEAFKPEFYRLCQRCGQDHGEGIVVEAAAPDQWTDRALMVLCGLIGLVLGLLTYFWIVLSRPG